MVFRFLIALLSLTLLSLSMTYAAQLCPHPQQGLKAENPYTHGEALAFSYQSNAYPVDLYSAYARRPAQAIDYCLRYEAINKGSQPVERFFWPLAGNLDIKSFAPQARPSILLTAKSENPPRIAPSKVYAFAHELIVSRAYRAEGQPTNEAAINSPTSNQNSRAWLDRIDLKAPIDLPEIGTQFADEKTEVTSLSSAKWDGKRLTIFVSVEANDSKLVSNIRAPVTWALAKGITDQKEFYSIARRLKDSPINQSKFAWAPTFEIRVPELFVIRSPIAFNTPTGRICFIANTYSPVPLSGDGIDCSAMQ